MNIEQIERIEERLLVTIAALGRSADEIRELCALARRGLERDDPILDGTDAAHPAWWRGHHHTALVFCRKVDDILDGKDNGGGANHEPWGALRRRLLAIAAPSSSAGEAEQQAGAICHCSCHNDPLYCHSCNECECHAPSPPSSAGETVCDYCDGSGFLNVLDEDGETVLDLCDAPAHDLEDAAPSGITSRCGNWPCTLKLGHSGPCSTSDPAEAATVVQTTPPEGFDEWYAEYGVGESTKDVARLAWNAAFRRTKHFAPATQETRAAGGDRDASMTSRCYNSPCALKPGHSGPCRSSTSDPYIALLDEPMGYAYAIATADGHVLVHLERGTTRNESEGGVEKLLALLNRTQETQAAGVTEAMVEAACAVFGWIKPSQYAISSMRAALEAAERVRNAGPKLAYYQTHEPPHCPTCDCAGPDEQGQK